MVLRCQIRVRGHLSRDWRDWFDDLTVANMPDGEALLFGGLPDQAALFGLLSRIQRTGISVMSIHAVNTKAEKRCLD